MFHERQHVVQINMRGSNAAGRALAHSSAPADTTATSCIPIYALLPIQTWQYLAHHNAEPRQGNTDVCSDTHVSVARDGRRVCDRPCGQVQSRGTNSLPPIFLPAATGQLPQPHLVPGDPSRAHRRTQTGNQVHVRVSAASAPPPPAQLRLAEQQPLTARRVLRAQRQPPAAPVPRGPRRRQRLKYV